MRRLLLRLVVVAVMGAMLLVMAVPAFADTVFDPAGEGATVVPKRCTTFGPIENCFHLTLTPSGNGETWHTLDTPLDPNGAPEIRQDVQTNPSNF